MFSPNPKPGKTLNEVTVEVVKCFCNSDEVSRVMPIMAGASGTHSLCVYVQFTKM
jgi:hypothetical protein